MVKDVIGFEGRYTVDDCGNIYSVAKNICMKQAKNDNGYMRVNLTIKGKKYKTMRVHRIVAQAFLNNPNNYEHVNHINGDKTDNRVCNLEWCTRKQNMQHAKKIGLFNHVGSNNPVSKLTKKQVDSIRQEYRHGDKAHEMKSLGEKYGVSKATIGLIIRGMRWNEA